VRRRLNSRRTTQGGKVVNLWLASCGCLQSSLKSATSRPGQSASVPRFQSSSQLFAVQGNHSLPCPSSMMTDHWMSSHRSILRVRLLTPRERTTNPPSIYLHYVTFTCLLITRTNHTITAVSNRVSISRLTYSSCPKP
jgi:hypothetical protein